MSNLDVTGPFDSYMEYSKLCKDQLYDKLLRGFNIEQYTGTTAFLPLFRKKAPLEVNKMRYSHVFFRMYRTDWVNTRNSLYMAGVKVPDRPKPIYLYKDGLISRMHEIVDNPTNKMVAYAVDKVHPCDYCIVVTSRHAYIRLLLLLYNNDYTVKNPNHIRVLYWECGRFYTSKTSPFWNLVKKDKTVAFLLDTFSINMQRPDNVNTQGHNSSVLDVLKSGEELSEALNYMK